MIEKQAERWYIELRESRYKYVASYKERIDSLFSSEEIKNEIVKERSEAYPEIAIRAISELHRIEMSIFNLFKILPNLTYDHEVKENHNVSNVRSGMGPRQSAVPASLTKSSLTL